MAYPGNPNLDLAVQQRILMAFKEAVRLYREGHGEEARTILRSIADVDASFNPCAPPGAGDRGGAPVDLAQLIGEVAAHATSTSKERWRRRIRRSPSAISRER